MDEDVRRNLGYVITTKFRNDPHTRFLVDRNKTKKIWWSLYLSDAFSFESEFAANMHCNKLKFGEFKVEPRRDFHHGS